MERDELRTTLVNHLETLRRNLQVVSMEVLKTKYKKPFDALRQDICKAATAYTRFLVFDGMRIKHKYFDDDEMWDKAESQLREILTELGLDFYEAEGEAAFYGPKLDVQLKSAIGHDVTVSTCQLDFLLPQRFELEYTGADGEKHRPVMIHRVVFGSIERFIGILTEHFAGAFPLWLSPVQVKILPIGAEHEEYARRVYDALDKAGLRAEVDARNEKIGYKIRQAQLEKVPYMLVVGDKEREDGTVAVRSRKAGDLGVSALSDFIAKVVEENDTKAL